MNILSIDPSLKATGWAIDDKTFGVWPLTYSNYEEALFTIRNNVEKLIIEKDITHIFREGYALGFKNAGLTRVMELGGVLLELAFRYKIPLISVAPKSIKICYTNQGNAKKEDVINVVNARLGLTVTDDNTADAIALLTIAREYLKLCPKCDQPFIKFSDKIRGILNV